MLIICDILLRNYHGLGVFVVSYHLQAIDMSAVLFQESVQRLILQYYRETGKEKFASCKSNAEKSQVYGDMSFWLELKGHHVDKGEVKVLLNNLKKRFKEVRGKSLQSGAAAPQWELYDEACNAFILDHDIVPTEVC